MVCFQTKKPNLDKFWRALEWKRIIIYFMFIWNILWRFGLFNDHLVHFVFIWYIFPGLVSCTKKTLATLVFNPHSKARNSIIKKIILHKKCAAIVRVQVAISK
jgi:hypothetical protein